MLRIAAEADRGSDIARTAAMRWIDIIIAPAQKGHARPLSVGAKGALTRPPDKAEDMEALGIFGRFGSRLGPLFSGFPSISLAHHFSRRVAVSRAANTGKTRRKKSALGEAGLVIKVAGLAGLLLTATGLFVELIVLR
jgi:hypothetical protein